jgi:autotransporter-associated beta strand protein
LLIGSGQTSDLGVTNLLNKLTLGVFGINMSAAGANLALDVGTITLGASQPWNVGTSRNLAASSVITGSGFGLTKTGAGTLTLSGANTYTGTTTMSAGTLKLSGGNNRLLSAGTVSFTGTSTLYLDGVSQTIASLTVAASVGATIAGSGGTLAVGSTVTANNGDTIAIGSGVTATIPTMQTSQNASSTWNINGTLSATLFTGAYEGRNFSGSTSTLNINNGGKATIGTMSISRIGWCQDATAQTVINVNTGGELTATTIQGIANDYGAIGYKRPHRYINVLGGRLNATTINLSAGGDSSTVRRLTVNNGTVANITTGNLTVDSSTAVYLQNNAYFDASGGRAITINGIVSQTGNLIKTGAGTLTLAAANIYTGATTLNSGVLNVTGAVSNSTATVFNGATLTVGGYLKAAAVNSGGFVRVTGNAGTVTVNDGGRMSLTGNSGVVRVNNGGLLTGTGTVSALTVNDGGTLSPGNSPGVFHVGAMTLASNATWAVELNSAYSYDQVIANGAVDLGGCTLSVHFGSAPVGSVFTILTNRTPSAISGQFSNDETIWVSDNLDTLVPLQFLYTEDTVQLTVVPEPSTWTLVALALVPLFLRRRRQ